MQDFNKVITEERNKTITCRTTDKVKSETQGL